jgi:ribosomal protein S18 acetylase RimI-like enzyme
VATALGAAAVRSAVMEERPMVVHTIVAAFAADPVVRWVWPEAHQYLESMPAFTVAFAGGGFSDGSAYTTDGYQGAALWLPPDVHPDENAVGDIVGRTVAKPLQRDLQTLMDKMAAFHPDGPHWYLPMIGVDPAHQNKGFGAALLRHALGRCDREGLPAYLESTNPRNISLYLRHGFVAVGEIQAGSSPTVVPMLRRPR